MNAYELADAIEDWDSDGQWDTPAANMLRQQADELTEAGGMIGVLREKVNQQADRIADLEKQYDAMVMSFEARLATRGYEIQIKDQQDRIAELEKQLKPVGNGTIGYLDDVPINDLVHRKSLPLPLPENTWTACAGCGQRVTGDSTHTCSPQTKPLSDEEIQEVWYDKMKNGNIGNGLIKFARAIEAKVRGQ